MFGKQLYAHVEKIAFDVVIDEVVEQAAKDLAYNAGRSIKDFMGTQFAVE